MTGRTEIRIVFWRIAFALLLGWRWWRDGVMAAVPRRERRSKRDARVLLPADAVFMRRLHLPVTVLGDLRCAAELSIARVTPFRAEDVAWDVRIAGGADGCRSIVADLAVVSRETVTAGLEGYARIASVGIAGDGGAEPFELLPAEHARRRRRGFWRLGAMAVLLLSILAVDTVWLARLAAIRDRLASDVAALRAPAAEAAARRRAKDIAARPAEIERAAAATTTLSLLLELTRQLPDDVQVIELRRDGQIVSLTGLAADAPAVLVAVERSPVFEGAVFTAPLSQGPGDGRQLFAMRATFLGSGND